MTEEEKRIKEAKRNDALRRYQSMGHGRTDLSFEEFLRQYYGEEVAREEQERSQREITISAAPPKYPNTELRASPYGGRTLEELQREQQEEEARKEQEEELRKRQEEQKRRSALREQKKAEQKIKDDEMNLILYQAAAKARPNLTYQQFMKERQEDANREMTPAEQQEYIGNESALYGNTKIDTRFIGSLMNDTSLSVEEKKSLAKVSEDLTPEFKERVYELGGAGKVMEMRKNKTEPRSKAEEDDQRIADELNYAANAAKKTNAFFRGAGNSLSFGAADAYQEMKLRRDREQGNIRAFDVTGNDMAKQKNKGIYTAGEITGELAKTAALAAATGGVGSAAAKAVTGGTKGVAAALVSNAVTDAIDNGLTHSIKVASGTETLAEGIGGFHEDMLTDAVTGALTDGLFRKISKVESSLAPELQTSMVNRFREPDYGKLQKLFADSNGKLSKRNKKIIKEFDSAGKLTRNNVRNPIYRIENASDEMMPNMPSHQTKKDLNFVKNSLEEYRKQGLDITKKIKDPKLHGKVVDLMQKSIDNTKNGVIKSFSDVLQEKVPDAIETAAKFGTQNSLENGLNLLSEKAGQALEEMQNTETVSLELPLTDTQLRFYKNHYDEMVDLAMRAVKKDPQYAFMGATEKMLALYDAKRKMEEKLRRQAQVNE